MANEFRKVAVAFALTGLASWASADVLTFDDVGTDPKAFFTSAYDGFTFGTDDEATNAWFYTDAVTTYNLPHSGNYYVSTDYSLYANDGSYQATQPISSATPFTFDGAWFSDDPAFANPDMITYELYNGSTLVYTSAPSAALTAAPQFVASGYGGLVTSVVIIGQQGYYAMDDFTYNTVAAVPEPQTYALMLGGLLAVASVVRRRSRR